MSSQPCFVGRVRRDSWSSKDAIGVCATGKQDRRRAAPRRSPILTVACGAYYPFDATCSCGAASVGVRLVMGLWRRQIALWPSRLTLDAFPLADPGPLAHPSDGLFRRGEGPRPVAGARRSLPRGDIDWTFHLAPDHASRINPRRKS